MASSANLAKMGDDMMMRCGLGALAMALALSAAPVRADVIKIFEANGVFEDGVKLAARFACGCAKVANDRNRLG
jgi:hypothetical protein